MSISSTVDKPRNLTTLWGMVNVRTAVLTVMSFSFASSIISVSLSAYVLCHFARIAAVLRDQFHATTEEVVSLKWTDAILLVIAIQFALLHLAGVFAVIKSKAQLYKAYVVYNTFFSAAFFAMQLAVTVFVAWQSCYPTSTTTFTETSGSIIMVENGQDAIKEIDIEIIETPISTKSHLDLSSLTINPVHVLVKVYFLSLLWRYIYIQRAQIALANAEVDESDMNSAEDDEDMSEKKHLIANDF